VLLARRARELFAQLGRSGVAHSRTMPAGPDIFKRPLAMIRA
jgi:hypothetical protein